MDKAFFYLRWFVGVQARSKTIMPQCWTRFLDAVGGEEISVEQLGVGGVQVIKDHALM